MVGQCYRERQFASMSSMVMSRKNEMDADFSDRFDG